MALAITPTELTFESGIRHLAEDNSNNLDICIIINNVYSAFRQLGISKSVLTRGISFHQWKPRKREIRNLRRKHSDPLPQYTSLRMVKRYSKVSDHGGSPVDLNVN